MGNRKYHKAVHKKKPQSAPLIDQSVEAAASAISIEELGLSPSTVQLLLKNNFKTAADLVKKTEKDMYRVQTLNKKILTEIVTALSKRGLKLLDSPQTEQQKRKEPIKPIQKGGSEVKENKQQDNKSAAMPKNKASDRPQPKAEEKPQIKTPLPPEEWRKVQRGNKWGFFDGVKTVIPPMYDEVFHFKEGLACVELDEKCGYIDTQNNLVIPCEYETAFSFSEGYAVVVKSGLCGYIDKNNNVVVDFQFDAATPFENGKARVKKDGRWGILEKDGNVKWNTKHTLN